jgi:uncharacterized membrane protein
MEDRSALDRARENATSIVSTLVTGIWLTALLTDQSWWLGALIFGYVVVVPVTAMLFGDEADAEEWTDRDPDRESNSETATDTADGQEEALETLRNRYARGELTDEQFERKLERLLETETLEDVEDRTRSKQQSDEREREREFS